MIGGIYFVKLPEENNWILGMIKDSSITLPLVCHQNEIKDILGTWNELKETQNIEDLCYVFRTKLVENILIQASLLEGLPKLMKIMGKIFFLVSNHILIPPGTLQKSFKFEMPVVQILPAQQTPANIPIKNPSISVFILLGENAWNINNLVNDIFNEEKKSLLGMDKARVEHMLSPIFCDLARVFLFGGVDIKNLKIYLPYEDIKKIETEELEIKEEDKILYEILKKNNCMVKNNYEDIRKNLLMSSIIYAFGCNDNEDNFVDIKIRESIKFNQTIIKNIVKNNGVKLLFINTCIRNPWLNFSVENNIDDVYKPFHVNTYLGKPKHTALALPIGHPDPQRAHEMALAFFEEVFWKKKSLGVAMSNARETMNKPENPLFTTKKIGGDRHDNWLGYNVLGESEIVLSPIEPVPRCVIHLPSESAPYLCETHPDNLNLILNSYSLSKGAPPPKFDEREIEIYHGPHDFGFNYRNLKIIGSLFKMTDKSCTIFLSISPDELKEKIIKICNESDYEKEENELQIAYPQLQVANFVKKKVWNEISSLLSILVYPLKLDEKNNIEIFFEILEQDVDGLENFLSSLDIVISFNINHLGTLEEKYKTSLKKGKINSELIQGFSKISILSNNAEIHQIDNTTFWVISDGLSQYGIDAKDQNLEIYELPKGKLQTLRYSFNDGRLKINVSPIVFLGCLGCFLDSKFSIKKIIPIDSEHKIVITIPDESEWSGQSKIRTISDFIIANNPIRRSTSNDQGILKWIQTEKPTGDLTDLSGEDKNDGVIIFGHIYYQLLKKLQLKKEYIDYFDNQIPRLYEIKFSHKTMDLALPMVLWSGYDENHEKLHSFDTIKRALSCIKDGLDNLVKNYGFYREFDDFSKENIGYEYQNLIKMYEKIPKQYVNQIRDSTFLGLFALENGENINKTRKNEIKRENLEAVKKIISQFKNDYAQTYSFDGIVKNLDNQVLTDVFITEKDLCHIDSFSFIDRIDYRVLAIPKYEGYCNNCHRFFSIKPRNSSPYKRYDLITDLQNPKTPCKKCQNTIESGHLRFYFPFYTLNLGLDDDLWDTWRTMYKDVFLERMFVFGSTYVEENNLSAIEKDIVRELVWKELKDKNGEVKVNWNLPIFVCLRKISTFSGASTYYTLVSFYFRKEEENVILHNLYVTKIGIGEKNKSDIDVELKKMKKINDAIMIKQSDYNTANYKQEISEDDYAGILISLIENPDLIKDEEGDSEQDILSKFRDQDLAPKTFENIYIINKIKGKKDLSEVIMTQHKIMYQLGKFIPILYYYKFSESKVKKISETQLIEYEDILPNQKFENITMKFLGIKNRKVKDTLKEIWNKLRNFKEKYHMGHIFGDFNARNILITTYADNIKLFFIDHEKTILDKNAPIALDFGKLILEIKKNAVTEELKQEEYEKVDGYFFEWLNNSFKIDLDKTAKEIEEKLTPYQKKYLGFLLSSIIAFTNVCKNKSDHFKTEPKTFHEFLGYALEKLKSYNISEDNPFKEILLAIATMSIDALRHISPVQENELQWKCCISTCLSASRYLFPELVPTDD